MHELDDDNNDLNIESDRETPGYIQSSFLIMTLLPL